MTFLRWLLALPLLFALSAPTAAQSLFSRGGGFQSGGHYRPGGGYPGGGYRGPGPWRGGFMPGLMLGAGAAAAHARQRPRYDDEPPPRRRVYHPDVVEWDEAPPPRQRWRPRRPVAEVFEPPRPRLNRRPPPPPPRQTPPPPIAAPNRALLPPVAEKRFATDEILVAFKTEAPGQAENFARAQRLNVVESRALKLIGVTVHRLQLPRGADLRAALRRAGRDSRLAWAQPNYLYQLQQPTVPAAASPEPKPESKAAPAPEGYAGAALNLPDAHRLARGQGVTVAVIDSQVDAAHPEFLGVATETFDPLGGAGAAHAHGTAMAGAISGHVKLPGAAPAARLLAVRAFDPDGGVARGASLPIAAGLDWAAHKGARVVSMSFAGPADPLLETMVVKAAGKGMALIAAAGNEGPSAPPQYPAAYAAVIAVAAVDEAGKVYRLGNRGGHIKLAAPGVDVLSAAPNGGYDLSTGTSIACAEVSGVAALLLEKNPGLDLAGLRRILGESARKIAGETLGAADAAAALQAK